MSAVKLFPGCVLACPRCDWRFMHQGEVQVFVRHNEDSPSGTAIAVDDVGLGLEFVAMSQNPSPRRDGLRIRIVCEGCGNASSLAIYQHKGETILAWED